MPAKPGFCENEPAILVFLMDRSLSTLWSWLGTCAVLWPSHGLSVFRFLTPPASTVVLLRCAIEVVALHIGRWDLHWLASMELLYATRLLYQSKK